MANISTNQVKQLYVVGASDTLAVETVKTAKGIEAYIKILDSNSNVKERTDLIYVDDLLTTTFATPASDALHRKAFKIELNSNVNGGVPVAGQDYIITLTYRGNYGEEATMHKIAEVHATVGMTAAQFYAQMAKSFVLNRKATSGEEFYNVFFDGSEVKTVAHAEDVDGAFYVVEPVPYWSLGRFPESLEKMEITTSTILVDTDMVTEWLASYAPVDAVSNSLVAAIPNSHKIADLEYFCKGERGISAPLHVAYRDQITPKLEVNPNSANGYAVFTIHYSFVGHNAANQRSEKDIVFVKENGAASAFTGVKAALMNLKFTGTTEGE